MDDNLTAIENQETTDTTKEPEMVLEDGDLREDPIEELPEKEESGYYDEEYFNAFSKKKKKKKKGVKIALIIAASLIVLAAGAVLIAYFTQRDYVLNTWAMMTKSDTEYLRYVVDRKADQEKAALSDKKFKFPDSFDSKGSVEASITEDFASLFDWNFSGFDDLKIGYGFMVEKGKTVAFELTPSYKGTEIAVLNGAYKKDEAKAYVSVPSYKKEVLDITALLEKLTQKDDGTSYGAGFIENLIDESKFSDEFSKLFDREKIIDKLKGFICDGIEEAEFKKNSNIVVNGLKRELNVISISIPHEKIAKALSESIDEVLLSLETAVPAIKGNIPGLATGDITENIRANVEDFLEHTKLTTDLSLYTDSKGDIQGGMITVVADTLSIPGLAIKPKDIGFQIKLLKDEKKDQEKSRLAGELSLVFEKMPISMFDFVNEWETKDGNTAFELFISPSEKFTSLLSTVQSLIKNLDDSVVSIIETVPDYTLSVSGNYSGDIADKGSSDITVTLKRKEKEAFVLHLINEFKSKASSLSMDLSEGNVIDIMELPNSGYMDSEKLLKDLVEKVGKINDKTVENLIDNKLSATVKDFTSDFSSTLELLMPDVMEELNAGNLVAALKKLTSSAHSAEVGKMLDAIVNNALRQLLGIAEPYKYSAVKEEPRMENDRYVYSWDILKDGDVSYENLSFKVYDHFRRPENHEVDIDKEKENFLNKYAGQVYTGPALEGAVVEMGDTICFDAVPLMFGIPVEAYMFDDAEAVVGQYEYGAGLDDNMVGMKVGETKEFPVTLDDRFGAFAGQTFDFRVTIERIDKNFGPEWSERFIVEKLGYESLEACEAEIISEAKKNLPEDIPEPTENEIKDALFNELIKAFPTDSYDDEAKNNAAEFRKNVVSMGGTILDRTYSGKLSDRDDTSYFLAKYALVSVIAYKEGISFSEDELFSAYDILLEELGFSDKDQMAAYEERMLGKRLLVDSVIERLVVDLIYSKADIIWE